MTEYQLAAMSRVGEHGEPIFRAPFVGCSGETTHDTDLQPQPVCPHCGHVERDAWEWNFGPGMEGEADVDCASCGEPFVCEREVTIYYSTKAALVATGETS